MNAQLSRIASLRRFNAAVDDLNGILAGGSAFSAKVRRPSNPGPRHSETTLSASSLGAAARITAVAALDAANRLFLLPDLEKGAPQVG